LIGEIVVKQVKNLSPSTQPSARPGLNMIGVTENNRISVALQPVNPKNFLIDPDAQTIEEAMGCAIEQFVGRHVVTQAQANGVYKDVYVGDAPVDTDLEETQELTYPQQDRVLLLRYYGLVPKALLEDPEKFTLSEEDSYTDLVEALVVIANGSTLLKAEPNPFMMQDRAVIAAQADSVPGRFWGRGTAEKAYNMQKAVDAQIRSHVDSLGYTSAPMMGMDATRMPRGFKFEIKPGKSILTNGSPSEILQPLKFGVTDKSNIETAQIFERMMLQATGTLDSANLPAQVSGGEAATAGLAMAIGSLLKKNRRALINFQEDFLIPFVQKAAWRYMQFAPNRYPVKDFDFVATATMGMVAREFEQAQMMALMSTLGPNSPITPVLLQGIIESSSLPNRESLLAQLTQMSQPDPAAQQLQQQSAQLQLATQQADVQEKQARAQKATAEAQKASVEAQLMPEKLRVDIVQAASTNIDDPNREFERRVKIAELMLKEKDIDSKVNIVREQTRQDAMN